MSGLTTLDWVFLILWVLFTGLYWSTYRKTDNLLMSAVKVLCLLGFVYVVIRGFDWLAAVVPPENVITFGIGDEPTVAGPRVPLLSDAIFWFAGLVVVLIAWHARKKVSTVGAVVMSAWDRGHWYMLPVLFILMTVGILLVAAAASPVLSPFIYTLF